MIKLPLPLDDYFEAVNTHNIAAMLACFASNAIVHDEGGTYQDITAIKTWIETTTAKYSATVETTDGREQEGTIIVTSQVTGNFDGSPLVMQYRFTMSNDKILALTITA